MTKSLYQSLQSGKWRLLFLSALLALITLPAHSQKSNDCGASCFSTKILSLNETEDGCLIYELEVSYEGDCKNALSNYSLEMGCGVFSNASNSEGWPMELNKTNPTSGLTGLKVDGIAEFGDESSLESFTVTFTFCPTDCDEEKSCFDPLVAYKAGQCLYKEEVNAQCILPLEVVASSNDLSCANTNDGSISLEVAGGELPYQVDWEHGETGLLLTDLSAGNYAYTVTSADGQSVAGELVISAPETIVVDAELTQPSCNTANGGSISLVVSGGAAPYSYNWQDGANVAERTGLASGIYPITITDASGCSVNKSFEIVDQTSLELMADVTQPGCGASSGNIALSVRGGESPYTYLWSDESTDSDRTSLGTGSYSVVVTDALGCETEASFEISEASQLTLTPTITHPTCSLSDGAIEILAEGGTAPYTYQWKHGASGPALSDLAAGYYMLTVTDANGCQSISSYSLVAQTNLYLSAKATNTNCQNEPIGAVDLTIYGGTAPFTYQWDNGAITEDISDLTEGFYKVTVTDAIGCKATLSQEVKRNTFFVLSKVNHKLCNTPGSIDQTIYYATDPIKYVWSNGETTEDLTNLAPGSYSVTITDGTGCEVVKSYTIYDSNNLGLSFNATTEGCGDQITYNLAGVAVGGTAPFEYLWSNGFTGSTLLDVQPGNYELTISDANGCKRTSSYAVEAEAGTADCLIQTVATPIECGSSGNIIATDVSDAQSYQWSVNSTDGLWTIDQGANAGQVSYTAGGESSKATFTLELITASGCIATCSYEVSSCAIAPSDNDPTDDGSTGDGSTDDGSTGDGSTGDGTNGDGSSGDGSTDDGSGGDGSTGDGSTDDGSTGDGSPGDGTNGDGSSGDGSTDDGSGGDGSTGDGANSGNNGTCVDCFDAEVMEVRVDEDTYTYSIRISNDLSCNYDLSNLVIAIPNCAVLGSFSNSMNWKMEQVSNDKNTGLSGIKVEGISSFGKDADLTEFTVSLTLRAIDDQCNQELACWSPEVAFKAGQCVTSELVQEACAVQEIDFKAYPNPASQSFNLNANTYQKGELFLLEIFDTQGNLIRRFTELQSDDLEQLSISLENINTSFIYLKVSGSKGSHWSSKLMISQ